MIMCDTHASGIIADLADSYLVRVEPRPNGGTHVLWTDEPDRAMVFDDAVVSFVPVAGAVSAAAPAAEPVNLADELRAMGLM